MKCSNCKNFKVHTEVTKKDGKDAASGTCEVNNKACNPEDECKTGLFDKMSAM